MRKLGVTVLIALCWASVSAAQTNCAAIIDPAARLRCYDQLHSQRAARPSGPNTAPGQACTPTAPCVGPRGGVYYITPSGNKRYLPRR